MKDVDSIALEHMAERDFGIDLTVKEIVVNRVDVGRAVQASVFLTPKKQLYCAIIGQSRLTLGDIKKIISRMGLKAADYLPLHGDDEYFEQTAREKFCEVFPGRAHITGDDLRFYRTLAPYNPALVRIAEVKDGVILQYDADAHNKWRPAKKFAYRRIKTS